jgi:hypothetical protein
MTEAAWEGADANNAMAAAAAKYSFMFHSPDGGPSFQSRSYCWRIYHRAVAREDGKRALRGKKIDVARV